MIRPVGFRVLVKPDKVKDHDKFEENDEGEMYTDSGIFLGKEEDESVKNILREGKAQTFGTIVGIGETAWKAYDDGEPWAKVGDRVAFAMYGGSWMTDPEDGEEYILLNDNDITAVIE